MPQRSLHSPLGELTVSEEDGCIVALDWGWGRDQTETPLLRESVARLQAYFDGAAVDFADLPMQPAGSAYRQRVWAELRRISSGQTRSYLEIARAIGGSPRSVGQANGANPIPILIPCHRVVAVAGIGGYSGAGGLETKQYLLDLEGVTVPQAPPHRNRGSLTNHPKTVVARLDPAIRGVPPASGLTDRTPSLKARAGSDGV